MGCNSHLSIEIRDPRSYGAKTGWEVFALDLPESRDYYMYAAMAGLRGDIEPIVEPRGIPSDVSVYVKAWFDRWGLDAHNPSYLYPDEYTKCIECVTTMALAKEYTQRSGLAKEWKAIKVTLRGLQTIYGKGNVRLVFFFDN